jgi:hypothetical protein
MRLLAPYLLVLFVVSTLALAVGSPIYASIAALQILSLLAGIAGLRYRIPILRYIAAPASTLLVLNAAAAVGLQKFLFTRGPLWKIWNSNKPVTGASTYQRDNLTSPKPAAIAAAMDNGASLRVNSNRP